MSIANAFISLKAAVRYLSIAVLLVVSWVYIYPLLSNLGIPTEQVSIITILIGIGLGSLVGLSISFTYDFLSNKYNKYNKKKSDLKRQENEERRYKEEQEIRNSIIAEKLESSIDYLSLEDRENLYLLTQTATTIDYREYDDNVLLDNEYVQIISRIDGLRVLVKINQAVFDVVKAHFEEYKKSKVESFLRSNENAEYILDILDITNSESVTPVNIDVIQSFSGFSCHIRSEFHPESGYFLNFQRFMFEAFEEQTGRKYSEDFFIPLERIERPDTSTTEVEN